MSWNDFTEQEKEDIVKRRQRTCEIKYGEDNPGKVKAFQDKSKITCNEKYGADTFFGSEIGKQKVKEGNRKKRGYDYALQDPEVIAKRENSLMEKYGVKNIKQVPAIKEASYRKFEQDLKDGKTKFHLIDCELNEPYHGQYNTDPETGKRTTAIKYAFKCKCCGEIFTDAFYTGQKNIINCPNCYPTVNASKWEVDISNWLKTLGISKIENNKRGILSRKREVDILLPEYNIAIECDGLYYHNELFHKPNDHLEKTEGCKEKGITLIQFYEDEWLNKKDICKSIIRRYLNLSLYKENIEGCVIEENNEAAEFFAKNNSLTLEKVSNVSYISLIKENNIIAQISLQKKDDKIIILNYIEKLNTKVENGFLKMVLYLRNKFKNKEIEFLVDKRFPVISEFEKILKENFSYKESQDPIYFYVNQLTRLSVESFRKEKLPLFKNVENLEESLLIKKNKWYKIYDCGKDVFTLK